PRARRSSGGLTSRVTDLLRFGQAQLEDERTAVLRTVRARPPGGVYGLGFFGERVDGTPVWGHGGSCGVLQSRMLLVPSTPVGCSLARFGRIGSRRAERVA